MNYIIVTNTYKRSTDLVGRSLTASLNQKVKPLKVILIDQNEEPLKLSKEIESNSIFERQQTKFNSVSAARNSLNIPNNTDWIFFCDDDGFPCENYSEILNQLIISNPEFKIFAGSIKRDDNLDFYSLRHKKGGSLKLFRNSKNLMGSNFVVHRDTFEQLKRFDDQFGVGAKFSSSEETDFCWKAYFNDIPMEFFPELVVYHVPPFNESITKGTLKSYRYGIGKGALVSKWLIYNRKIIVLFELLEMFSLPFIQIIRGVITLKPGLITSNIAAFCGRCLGIVKFIIYWNEKNP